MAAQCDCGFGEVGVCRKLEVSGRQRRDSNLHFKQLLATAQNDAAHRRDIAEIAPPTQGNVLALHKTAVGRIKIHPA